jgi:hypothetical protein
MAGLSNGVNENSSGLRVRSERNTELIRKTSDAMSSSSFFLGLICIAEPGSLKDHATQWYRPSLFIISGKAFSPGSTLPIEYSSIKFHPSRYSLFQMAMV